MVSKIGSIGFGKPKKTELQEYKELKNKRHLSEADKKRLGQLEAELKWRGVLDDSGRVKGEEVPASLFDTAKSHRDYERYQMTKDIAFFK